MYKRLAVHLGLVNVHLGPGPAAERLVDAWARGAGLGGWDGARPQIDRWRNAVRRGLAEKPPRTKASGDVWRELAEAFGPAGAKVREKKCLSEMLLRPADKPLGALPQIWELQGGYDAATFEEEALHDQLERRQPGFRPLLDAIRTYEAFARSMQDAFDVLKAVAAGQDAAGFLIADVSKDKEFQQCAKSLNTRFEAAHRALGEAGVTSTALQNLFADKFGVFAEPMDAGACAQALCDHHALVQRKKSADGKRPWFDTLALVASTSDTRFESRGGHRPHSLSARIPRSPDSAFPRGPLMRPRRSTSSTGTLLDLWRPPHGAGDAVGCLATTYTFAPGLFDEQCLARFLEIESEPNREDLAFLLEREDRLGASMRECSWTIPRRESSTPTAGTCCQCASGGEATRQAEPARVARACQSDRDLGEPDRQGTARTTRWLCPWMRRRARATTSC